MNGLVAGCSSPSMSALAIGWLGERGVDLGAPLALFIATRVPVTLLTLTLAGGWLALIGLSA